MIPPETWEDDDPEDPGLGLDSGLLDLIVLHDGTTMQTHGPAQCSITHCCIHHPSDHPLRSAPLSWMANINLMLRVCKHGASHPDPDSMNYIRWVAMVPFDGWHPCCPEQCCLPASARVPEEDQ